jgi:hypothetical protein
MERDRQFAGVEHAHHFDSNQTLCDKNGVPTVDRDRVDRLQPCTCFALVAYLGPLLGMFLFLRASRC